jgi:hypothetical protein
MNRFVSPLLIGFAAFVLGASVIASDAPRELTWPDLQPESVKKLIEQAYQAERDMMDLPEKEREAYDLVREELSLRKRIELGFIDEDRLDDVAKASLANPASKRFPKALKFWNDVGSLYDRIEQEKKKPNLALNSQRIRMPGYLLPLEFTEDKISEFLLVPYIGACMHAPVPDPNQMIFVTAPEPFKSDRLYQAVWVEGVLRSENGTHRLSLVDGSSNVDASYTMQATLIEPYKQR